MLFGVGNNTTRTGRKQDRRQGGRQPSNVQGKVQKMNQDPLINLEARIKISVNTDIAVIGFYGNIGNIGKISVDIFTKISVIKFFLYFNYIDYEK